MINATDLFERTDKAFRTLREMAEGREVTPEWARLYAKGTAVANAGAVYRAAIEAGDYDNLAPVIAIVNTTLNAMIENAEYDIVSVKEATNKAEAEFRNAIANGRVDGYKVALDYFNEEIKYFTKG